MPAAMEIIARGTEILETFLFANSTEYINRIKITSLKYGKTNKGTQRVVRDKPG